MTPRSTTYDTSRSDVEVFVDGVRRPGTLHEIWRRGGEDLCEVSWHPGPGVTRIDTVSAQDVWIAPTCLRAPHQR